MTEAVTGGDSLKKGGSLKLSQNSQEITCVRVSFLMKLKRDFGTCVLL